MNNSNTNIIDKERENYKLIEDLDTYVYYKGKGRISNGLFTKIDLPKNVDKNVTDLGIEIIPIHSNENRDYCFIDAEKSSLSYVQPLYPSKIQNNSFIVYGPKTSFFWIVTGKRKDIDKNINIISNNSFSRFEDKLYNH